MTRAALSVILVFGSAQMFAQQSSLPTEKPAVFDGKRNPKEDKSRLRDLKGIVEDRAGAPVDGAIVQLKDMKKGKIIDFITKPDGKYTFFDLNMDVDYEVTAKKDGAGEPIKKKLTKWDSRKPATLNFELIPKKTAS